MRNDNDKFETQTVDKKIKFQHLANSERNYSIAQRLVDSVCIIMITERGFYVMTGNAWKDNWNCFRVPGRCFLSGILKSLQLSVHFLPRNYRYIISCTEAIVSSLQTVFWITSNTSDQTFLTLCTGLSLTICT